MYVCVWVCVYARAAHRKNVYVSRFVKKLVMGA